MNNYTLIHSKRKTIAICITKKATVEVRAPVKASKNEIDRFVQAKEKWITQHLLARTIEIEKKVKFALNYGDKVLYRGRKYPVIGNPGESIGFDGTGFHVSTNLNSEEIKYAIIGIYKKLALRDIGDKVNDFARVMNVMPIAVKVNSAKTRWGSCSCKNSINFPWRLILAEDSIIDYVVVHELAHIKEHNHSAHFWSVVEGTLSDYKVRQKGLEELQSKMATEDWD